MPAGSVLCRRGENPQHWFGVIDGLLKWSVSQADGRSASLGGLSAGSGFGEGTLMGGNAIPPMSSRLGPVALRWCPSLRIVASALQCGATAPGRREGDRDRIRRHHGRRSRRLTAAGAAVAAMARVIASRGESMRPNGPRERSTHRSNSPSIQRKPVFERLPQEVGEALHRAWHLHAVGTNHVQLRGERAHRAPLVQQHDEFFRMQGGLRGEIR